MKHTLQTPTMHKAMIAIAAAGLFSLGASAAFAQQAPQTVDMTVTGTIVPAACSAKFENGGVVNFGTIRLIDLPANAYYLLGSKNIALNVSCSANKRVSFSVADMQSASRMTDATMVSLLGTLGPGYPLGLGASMVSGNPVSLGSYAINMDSASTDTGGRYTIYSNNSGASWTGSGGREYVLPNGAALFSVGANTTSQAAGQTFKFPLIITAALNYGSRLQVAQDTPLNGQAVFSINYQ